MGRSGKVKVDGECDLHGFTRREALAELEQAIRELRRRGGRRLRVIHGCGEVLSEMVYEYAGRTAGLVATPERNNPGSCILEIK